MANRILINEQTAAVITEAERIDKDEVPVIFAASGLTSGEEIGIEIEINGNWVQVVENGNDIKLTINDIVRKCNGPCRVRLNKPLTASAVSVERIDRYTD